MEANRPIVMSIAGFDPCGGAGILADIKTFEQHNVYGLAINTAQTVQTENDFISIRWETEDNILKALETMLAHYDVKSCLLYTSDAADEEDSVDLGGRRII